MLSIVRIVFALLFIVHGTQKLFGLPSGMGPVPMASQMGVGAVLETVGGLLLLLGLFTRPVAFVLAGQMAVAYFQFHAPSGFWPSNNKGEPAVLFCFIWLYYFVAGPGAWSLDSLLAKARPKPKAAVRGKQATAVG